MTSTEYVTDPVAAEWAVEQDEQFETETVEYAEGVGAPLLAMLVGGMALTLAVLTPVAGVKVGGLLIVVATALVTLRLLRRGGGRR